MFCEYGTPRIIVQRTIHTSIRTAHKNNKNDSFCHRTKYMQCWSILYSLSCAGRKRNWTERARIKLFCHVSRVFSWKILLLFSFSHGGSHAHAHAYALHNNNHNDNNNVSICVVYVVAIDGPAMSEISIYVRQMINKFFKRASSSHRKWKSKLHQHEMCVDCTWITR